VVDPSNLFGNEFEDVDSGVETTATATASTAASSCTMSSHGGKDQAHQQGWGRKRIPRKSPSSNASDEGEEGNSFRNMMYMLMMQSRMDNERREQHYKNESKQRECEYQLRREEMAMTREEARDQKQMMNLTFMAMLTKNGWTDNSNPTPPSPGPGKTSNPPPPTPSPGNNA
jgi:hypothetical protein